MFRGALVGTFFILFLAWLNSPRKPDTVMFLFDASPSMAEEVEDGSRIDVARAALKATVSDIAEPVGLVAFGSLPCGAEVLVTPKPGAAGDVAHALDAVIPIEGTPIAAAFRESAAVVELDSPGRHSFVLLSDGEENCGGDAVAVVQDLIKAHANLEIHVVAFQPTLESSKHLRRIASAGRGRYIEANKSSDLGPALGLSTGAPLSWIRAECFSLLLIGAVLSGVRRLLDLCMRPAPAESMPVPPEAQDREKPAA